MAASHNHAISNSLPSKPHPLVLQCNEHCRLESSSATTTPSSSSSSPSSSLIHKLIGLQDLHDSVENWFNFPKLMKSFSKRKEENDLMDGSLRLLDECSAAKDALLHTKECAREVQSILTRKRGGEMEVIVEIRKYLTSRKIVKKAISKALSDLKTASSKFKLPKGHQSAELAGLLKDVEVVTLHVLESVLSFISGPSVSKPSNWSLVLKLMHNKKVSCLGEADDNEFAKLDAALQAFCVSWFNKSENVSDLQNQMEILESVIQDFVEGLEALFRRFIKTRTALLNILTH